MSKLWPARLTNLTRALIVLALTSVACKRLPAETVAEAVVADEPVPVSSIDITTVAVSPETGTRVASLDLEGDGVDEVVMVSETAAHLLRVRPSGETEFLWRADAEGGPTAIATGDIDGDGKDDLVVGWGRGRAHRDAVARLVGYVTSGAEDGSLRREVIAEPVTERAEFTSVSVTGLESKTKGVLWAVFVSKYDVASSFSRREPSGSWQQKPLATMRMGSEWAAIRFPRRTALVVGRPYGDTQHSFGDVREWSEDPKARRPLPSVRGVRSLAPVRVGAQPRALICYGAGWHWRYGEQAKGILTCAQPSASGAWEAQIVDELGMYEVSAIADADLDGDGTRELIALGPDGLYAYTPAFTGSNLTGTEWKRRTVAAGASGFAVVDLEGDGKDELITAGPPPRIHRLRLARP